MKQLHSDLNKIQQYQSIYMNVSGGTDSALLLFLIAKHINDNNLSTKITPAAGVEPQPYYIKNDWYVEKIVSIIKSFFPLINMQNAIITQFEGYTRDKSKDNPYPKISCMKKMNNKHVENGHYDLIIDAITSFPPLSELKKYKDLHLATTYIGPEDRTYTNTRNDAIIQNQGIDWWQPMINFHKKDIAKLYEHYDLMDNLFPYTASCTGNASDTKNFTDSCKKCFWCLEKYWAFGLFDYPKRLIS